MAKPAIVQSYVAGLHEPNKDLLLSLLATDGHAANQAALVSSTLALTGSRDSTE